MSKEQVESVLGGLVTNLKGYGLGVLLAKVSTEVQDGVFELTSTEGVGTRIRIALPMPPKEGK